MPGCSRARVTTLYLRAALGALAILLLTAPALAQQPRPPAAAASAPVPAPSASSPAPADRAGAGTSTKGVPPAPGAPPSVVSTEESKEGVKTYKFGAVEVEGRLRSPQLIYFLRRVRAEFTAGDLGHRSFLREPAETQRHPSFR